MKIQKRIFICACALLMVFTTMISVKAGSVTNGVYQTVRHIDIPGGGESHYETTYGSKKTDDDMYATFLLTYEEAWLGNFAHLITQGKVIRSGEVGLIYEEEVLAREQSSITKNTNYYSAVSSNKFEPSNTCDVIIKFSADNLKELNWP